MRLKKYDNKIVHNLRKLLLDFIYMYKYVPFKYVMYIHVSYKYIDNNMCYNK